MTIYFGSSTDAELASELKERGYCVIKAIEANVANKLAANELSRLKHENFGYVPRDDWASRVTDLRDALDLAGIKP